MPSTVYLHIIFNVKTIIDMGNSVQRKLGSSRGQQQVESQPKLQRSQHHPCFKMAAEVDPKTKSYTKALPRFPHSNNLKKMWVLMYITKSLGTMFCHGSRPTSKQQLCVDPGWWSSPGVLWNFMDSVNFWPFWNWIH